MDTKIQHIGTAGEVNFLFDPLRKDDSFIVFLNGGRFKSGFILPDDVILESDANIEWDEVKSIMGGFSTFETFIRIKDKINEKNK